MCELQEGRGPLRTEQGGDDRAAVGRVGGGSRLVAASALWRRATDRRHPHARRASRLARDRRDGLRLHRVRKRGTGVRHRPGPERSDVAAAVERRNGVHTDRGRARRSAVPPRRAREALPGPADLNKRRIGADHRPHAEAAVPWNRSTYKQSIPSSGYTYLTTRDGTQLAIDVHPPTLPVDETQRCGSDADRILGIRLREPARPGKRARRSGQQPIGFAVVDVNMRGTGCSGGAFNYFEPLQNLDAYDVIQTIAHQPWVLHHKVGMFGVSYGGISQLFAAQLRPPALEAIAPLSVVDATATTLYPGGILNTGFAVPWARRPPVRRVAGRSRPAASTGPTNRSRKATRPARPTRICTKRRRTCTRKSKKTRPTTRLWPTRWTR